jgi:hypothetical protein
MNAQQLALCVALLCTSRLRSERSFKDLDYGTLNSRTVGLDGPYAIISNAKELYGIEEVEQKNIKCTAAIARITDRASLVEDNQRPQVIISGEIHGDERVVRLVHDIFVQS